MHRFLAAIALLGLLLPLGAAAQYMEPEEVILRDQYYYPQEETGTTGIPRNKREAAQAAQAQEQRNTAQNRPTFEEWWTKAPEETMTAEESAPPTASAPSAPAHAGPSDHEGNASHTITIDPITARLLLRLQARETEASIGSAHDVQHSTALHAGAPLSDTGPAQTITVLLMLGVAAAVIARAKGMRQFIDL